MKRNKRNWFYLLLVIFVLGITLGYAYLNTDLNINGTTNVSSASWNIYWDNIVLGNHNTTDVVTPATIKTGETEVEFNVNFNEPGDTYEFTVDAVNDGTINGMVNVVSNGVYSPNGQNTKPLPDFLEYTVTYKDGVPISQYHILEAGESETYFVKVKFKDETTPSQLPSTDDNYLFKFSVEYVQANQNAIEVNHFTTDSWENILSNIRNNNVKYTPGSTKEVDLGTLGTHTLRIANNSTPSECSTTGFSQTSCGFVLEFADIITTHNMNSTDTNVGGWPASSMRNYINTDIYNAIPTVLKNAIINTTVVSGHGKTEGEENFVSNDKMYLISPVELWGNNSTADNDTARNLTRQLDYYNSIGADNSHYGRVSKYYESVKNPWWLRTSHSNNTTNFTYVQDTGGKSNIIASNTYGVSPAFRIA